MIATDMTTGGSIEEQLRWAFKMYDQDGSGIYHKIFKGAGDVSANSVRPD